MAKTAMSITTKLIKNNSMVSSQGNDAFHEFRHAFLPCQWPSRLRANRGHLLPTKVVKKNVFVLHTQVLKHLDDCGIHHGGAAEIILAILRSRMIL